MKTINKKMLPVILLILAIFFNTKETLAATYTVTNTLDAGPGSLRQAIIDANANPGADVIRFNIPTTGNLFEGSAPYTYAVIEINTALPTITEAVLIDGTTQANTNTGGTSTQIVGVDGITLASIPRPDIYLVPSASFVFPTNSNGTSGNGLTIDAINVTLQGLAISGFGNTHTNGGIASAHADISVPRSPVSRTANITITNCFISCDPTGANPSQSQRKTKGSSILICGNNETGNISNNYIAYSGTYGIHFNGSTDNNNVGPSGTTVGNRYWTITGNQLIDVSTNNTISAITRASDAITLMKCVYFKVKNNYINNAEQMGVDIGFNSDSNYIANNTITNFVKTTAFQLQAAIRIGINSESDTLAKNVILNNTSGIFKAGIWLDRSVITQTGVIVKNNINHLIQQNSIHDNNGSAIVLSNNGAGECYNNRITQNSTYSNVGLGIDLDFSGTSGSTLVTPDDDGDADTGPNNIQNFPIIDSVRRIGANSIGFYGKAPAGSTLEFYMSDGQANKQGGMSLNYGEGKTFIGSAVEGSASDNASGLASYNVDGNVANNNTNLFFITLPYSGTFTSQDSVTATSTVANNTSEFGPVVTVFSSLAVNLLSFSSSYADNNVTLNWRANSDNQFLYFDVEHSTDGKSFSRIGSVYPKTTDEINNYSFTHTNISDGDHYYRLKMVNAGGKVSYSSILSVPLKLKNSDALKIKSFFTNRIDLQGKADKEEEIGVNLFNEKGQLVRYTQVHGNRGINFIQLENLQASAGMYIIQISKGKNVITQKLIKQ
jgi:hypothetical protein